MPGREHDVEIVRVDPEQDRGHSTAAAAAAVAADAVDEQVGIPGTIPATMVVLTRL